jgi:hypothetical protein
MLLMGIRREQRATTYHASHGERNLVDDFSPSGTPDMSSFACIQPLPAWAWHHRPESGQHSIRYRPRAKIIPLQQTLLPRHASLLRHLRHHPRRRPRNHHPLDRLRPVLRTAMPLL